MRTGRIIGHAQLPQIRAAGHLFEKDLTANTIRNFPKKKILMAEPVEMPIVGPLWVGDTSREALLEAWEGMLIKSRACVTTGARLENIENADGRFLVTISGKVFACDKVILALGNRGVPRKLGIRGEDGPNVFYNLLEAEEFPAARSPSSAPEIRPSRRLWPCSAMVVDVTMLRPWRGFPKAKSRNQERIARRVQEAGSISNSTASRSEIGTDFIVLPRRR